MTRFFSRVRVRRVIGSLVRNRRAQLLARSRWRGRYLNLGAGGNIRSEFVNVDHEWRPGLNLCWDLRRGLPLESGSVEGVVTEHTLEHFTWREATGVFLPECFRVLKPGGVVRIAVPDAERAVDLYLTARDRGELASAFAERPIGERIPMTPMTHLNNTFRRIFEPLSVGHKFAYDFHTLAYFLSLAGFVDVRRERFMQGRDAMLLVDTERRAHETLYVEANKPL
jgi:predicted SAM-dependent methyltransferase